MRLETFNSLARTEFSMAWIVEGLLLPGQWTYLVGPPGSGKSMLTIQLCDALQEGKPFLGMATKKHNCLYIQADAGLFAWKEQVRLLAGDSFAWTLHDIEKGFLDKPQWVQYFHDTVWGTYSEEDQRSKVLKHIPYDFVVFDCLNAITEQDINAKTAMNNILKKLEFITTKVEGEDVNKKTIKQAEYLLIHHPTKGETRGVNAGAGSGGFSALCGNMLTLANDILVPGS